MEETDLLTEFTCKQEYECSDSENEEAPNTLEQPGEGFHEQLIDKIDGEPGLEPEQLNIKLETPSTSILDQLHRVPPPRASTNQNNIDMLQIVPSTVSTNSVAALKTMRDTLKIEIDSLVEVATKVNKNINDEQLKSFALNALLKYCPEELQTDLLNGTFTEEKDYGISLGLLLQSFVEDVRPERLLVVKRPGTKRKWSNNEL